MEEATREKVGPQKRRVICAQVLFFGAVPNVSI